MILGVEIALILIGCLALVRGRMTITASKIVYGVPARLLGALALTPLPLAFAVGLTYVAVNAPADPERFAQDNKWTLTAIEAGIVIGVAVLVFAIGTAVAISPAEVERRERLRRQDEEEEEEFEEKDDGHDAERDRDRRSWER